MSVLVTCCCYNTLPQACVIKHVYLLSYSYIDQKSKMDHQDFILCGSSRGESISWSFPASRGPLYFLAHDPFVHFQSWHHSIFSHVWCFLSSLHFLSLTLILLLSSYNYIIIIIQCDYIGSMQIIQDYLPISRFLIWLYLQNPFNM